MKILGRIAGWWGLVALITAPITWKVAGSTEALSELGAGVVLVILFAVTNRGASISRAKELETQRGSFFIGTSVLIAAATLAVLVGINFIASKRAKTIDLTNKKIYSLAPQTQAALKQMTMPVKAIGFMGSDHPAYDVLKGLFERFTNESDKFTYEFKDPKKSIELNAKYQIKEGQTTVILSRGSGANETHTALAVVSEQDLTNALMKLESSGTQKIYFLAGHAEYPLGGAAVGASIEGQPPSLSELKQSLEQEGYAVDALDLAAAQNQIPIDAAMLVIAHASVAFTQAEVDTIDRFLSQGGRLLYFADWDVSSGLETTLAKFGVQIENGVVADALNPENPFQAVGFPTEHEISAILKRLGANLPIESSRGLVPLKAGGFPGVNPTPVLLSSPKGWIETTPENPEPSEFERLGAIPMIMASTADTKATAGKRFDEMRLVVFGDSSLILNSKWGDEVARNLVLNAFGWASTEIQRITIRPPDRDISTINIDDQMMARIQFLSIILMPQLMIALGIAIRVMRRNK